MRLSIADIEGLKPGEMLLAVDGDLPSLMRIDEINFESKVIHCTEIKTGYDYALSFKFIIKYFSRLTRSTVIWSKLNER